MTVKLVEKPAVDLIDEATQLLRHSPVRLWLSYYLGSLPFVLGLLYFWSDMSRSALAADRLPGAALGLGLLFVWMKTWQAVFAQQLLRWRCGELGLRWTGTELVRLGVSQAITQPWGLFLLPIALITMAPFGWAYAFFQNLTALAATESASVRALIRKAWRQACLWPGQNHAVVLILPLVALVVFINLFLLAVLTAMLLDKVFGIQTPFSQSWWAILNTTFLAAVGALTYLCVDPLCKAVYVLRCFYGDAIRSGLDLKAELRRLAGSPAGAWATLLLCVGLLAGTTGHAAPEAEPATGPSPSAAGPTTKPVTWAFAPAELDRALDQALDSREFLWRLPREQTVKRTDRPGWLRRLLDGLFDSLKAVLKPVLDTVGRWIEKAVRWVAQRLQLGLNLEPTPGDWTGPLRVLVLVLLGGLVGAVIWLLVRIRLGRRRRDELTAVSQPLSPEPDLTDPNLGPEQLPEDAWMRLAGELLQRGELRLALRALYLSSLAHLANRGLIGLARFKSNLDYVLELSRRAHVWPELVEVFRRNVAIFDRAWYGLHEVSHELLAEFASNVERIKAT